MRNVTRFKIRGHGLKCETGLYGRSPDRSARFCNLCENGDIQNEEHVIFSFMGTAPVQPFIKNSEGDIKGFIYQHDSEVYKFISYRYGFFPNANCPFCPCTDSALHILSGCQHTKMRNMIIKRHNTASVLISQALQKGPCGANQFAYTDVGSADKLSEQGLDLRNTANKTLPSWLLPKLTAHALKASSRPDAILFLPSTVCSSRVTTRNPNFQQLRN